MDEIVDAEAGESLFWRVWEKREAIDRQLLYVLRLWHDRNENYGRVAEAVRVSAMELRKVAQGIEDAADRRDSLRSIGRILSVISFHDEHAPYVQGSGGQRPARPRHEIESVTLGGLPGQGKRR